MCYLCNSIACFPNFLPQWSSCYFHVFSVTPCRGFVLSVFQDTVISADDILSRHTLGKIISKQEKYSSGKRNMLTQKALRIAAKCSPCEKGWSQADMWTIIVCSNTRWAFKVKMETGLKTATLEFLSSRCRQMHAFPYGAHFYPSNLASCFGPALPVNTAALNLWAQMAHTPQQNSTLCCFLFLLSSSKSLLSNVAASRVNTLPPRPPHTHTHMPCAHYSSTTVTLH